MFSSNQSEISTINYYDEGISIIEFILKFNIIKSRIDSRSQVRDRFIFYYREIFKLNMMESISISRTEMWDKS